MKLQKSIVFGVAACLGYVAYTTYHKHRHSGEKITKETDISDNILETIQKIHHSVDDINKQLPMLKTLSKDLTYKQQVFKQETQGHLKQIKATLNKYQKES